jgi:hypothetical protein
MNIRTLNKKLSVPFSGYNAALPDGRSCDRHEQSHPRTCPKKESSTLFMSEDHKW